MKILITGGGGFLGRHIFKELLGKGHELFSFSRSDYPFYRENNITWISGDLKNYDDVAKAILGKDIVFHTASKVGMWGKWEDFYNPNVIGTENVIKACKDFGVKKLIYTSSPSVVFGDTDLKGVDESTPYPKKYYSFYGETKAMAERSVLKANGTDLFTVALRPHLIFGEEDPHLIPRILEKAKKKRLFQIGNGQNIVDVIHVENAAHAHILAMEKLGPESKVNGKAYFLGQERPVKLWSFLNDILELGPLKTVSPKFALFMGNTLEKIYTTFNIYKKEPPITRFVVYQLCKSHYFDHKNSLSDLNYHPIVSLETAIKRLKAQIRQN